MPSGNNETLTEEPRDTRRSRGRRKLLAVLAVCAAPVIASYLTYYLVKPSGRTNYGTLIDPQRDLTGLQGTELDGGRFELSSLKGRWVLLTVDSGNCEKACQDKLYAIRQVRLTTGKDRERVERVLLLTDSGVPADPVLEGHEGLKVARIPPEAGKRFFPLPAGSPLSGHIYIVDPLGNLMMRFPMNADPNRMKKDLAKLLRASRVG